MAKKLSKSNIIPSAIYNKNPEEELEIIAKNKKMDLGKIIRLI